MITKISFYITAHLKFISILINATRDEGVHRTVLTLKCAACKRKLWKYEKIGQGQVLRCYKDRITRRYALRQVDDAIFCECGKKIGVDEGNTIKMISNAFTYTGTKRNS